MANPCVFSTVFGFLLFFFLCKNFHLLEQQFAYKIIASIMDIPEENKY